MARLKIILLFILFNYSYQLKAFTDSTLRVKLTKTILGDYASFSVDNLGNIFFITASNQIKKINNNYDSVGTYNDVKRYGNIYTIDVTNPLKVLVYYKDFATIVMLDRQLNNRNTINLREQNILQVKAIAQSYDNNIWLFDELESKLKKIDESGKILLETADFRLLFDDAATPQCIIDMNGLLYLYNVTKGWTIFDYYGGLKNQFPLLNWQDVQVTDNFLRGRDGTYLYAANPSLLQFIKVQSAINLASVLKIIINPGLLYILKKDRLEIYSIL